MNQLNKLIIPISIIIAGALVAGAIYMTSKAPATVKNSGTASQQVADALKGEVAPVTDADHIRGNKNAKVVIIDYSDYECPFCKVFHESVKKIFDEYSKDNQVAWVYRHFPLDIHPKARTEAEGAECANELGGSEAFWSFTDNLYSITPSNNQLDLKELGNIADKIGLDKAKFQACVDSGKYKTKIEEQTQAALKAGGTGTPYTVIMIGDQSIPLVDAQGRGLGALPYASLKSIVEQFIKQANS